MPKNSHKDSKVPSTSSALLQPSQIEFVFESITSLLQTIDCELKNTFITIKESIEKQDNKNASIHTLHTQRAKQNTADNKGFYPLSYAP